MGEAKKTEVIDFLYKDLSRISSFYAQIFKGKPERIIKTMSTEKISTKNMDANAFVLKGGVKVRGKDTKGSQLYIEPHDQGIIELLEHLNIPLLEDTFDNTHSGQLILIRGNIAIRNYKAIRDAMPIFFDISTSNATTKQDRRRLKQEKDMVRKMLGLIPMGLELELVAANGDRILAALKPENLSESPDDLLRIYGNHIPGSWYVLGIIDHPKTTKQISSANEVRGSIDEFAKAIRSMYSDAASNYIINPVLIFRIVTVQGNSENS